MAHKTTINGTSYEVVGGRTLVDGTRYDIIKGQTLVNDTEYDILFGVKWLKFDCKVTTTATYNQYSTPSNIPFNLNQPADKYAYSYADYYFTTDQGFIGTNEIKHTNGRHMTGYHVTDTGVYAYEDNGTDLGTGWINYICPCVASASRNETTTYSKGSTSYGAIYADKNEMPEDGTLMAGSVGGSYCVVKIGKNYYYYERV